MSTTRRKAPPGLVLFLPLLLGPSLACDVGESTPSDLSGGPCLGEGEAGRLGAASLRCCAELVGVPYDAPDGGGVCGGEARSDAFVCTRCGDGACSMGENHCNCAEDCPAVTQCAVEGSSVPVVPGALDCCPGLASIGCEGPPTAEVCEGDCAGAVICARCGNGLCGLGENACNCAQDCAPGGACAAAGESVPVVPGAPDCCDGLHPIGCDAPGDFGLCPDECVGAIVCANCGNGSCGPGENRCNCADDCSTGSQCAAEGTSVPLIPGALECCGGLEPIGCETPEGAGLCPQECVGAAVCARCGNGSCGPGENECNCAVDCLTAQP